MSKFSVMITLNTMDEDCILPCLLGFLVDAPDEKYARKIAMTASEAFGMTEYINEIDVSELCDCGDPQCPISSAQPEDPMPNFMREILDVTPAFQVSQDQSNLPGGIIVVVDRSLRTDGFKPMPETDLVAEKFDRFVLIGPGIPQVHRPDETMPCLFYMPIPDGSGVIAIPTVYKSQAVRFGGNYVRVTDGTFNNGKPIAVFDSLQ